MIIDTSKKHKIAHNLSSLGAIPLRRVKYQGPSPKRRQSVTALLQYQLKRLPINRARSHECQKICPALSLSLDLYALAIFLHLAEVAMALKTLHERLDGMEVTRLHDGRVVVAFFDGLPDLCWGLAELVELAHVLGAVCMWSADVAGYGCEHI